MMNNASFDSCSVCTDKPEPTNCCSIISKEIKFSDQQKSVCCKTLLVAEPIEDNFVQSKIEIAKIHNELYFSNINIDSNNYFTKTFSIRISSHSPPIVSEDLYTINSTFLI
jgi:hypothetical protein